MNTCFNKIPQAKPINGGALHLINSTNIFLKNCTFSNNFYGNSGGAIYFESSLFKIYFCTFYNNQALNSGGAIFFSNLHIKNPDCIIMNTNFTNNIAKYKGGGIFLMHYSPIFLKNVTFESNKASAGASLYFISKNKYRSSNLALQIQQSTFNINILSSKTHIQSNVDINNFNDIIFNDCTFRSDIKFDIDTIKFYHLSAQQTSITFRNKNYVDGPNTTFFITDTKFTNIIFNYDFERGEVVIKDVTIPVIQETVFTNRQQFIEIQKNVRIINSKFTRIISQENGGAVYLAHCPRVSIKSASFISTKSRQKGGAIYCNQSQIELFDSSFQNCISYQEGGAIYIDVQSGYLRYFNIMNCDFDSNEAKFNGGAIMIKNSLNLLIAKCTFNLNYADLNGLSIYSYGMNDFVFYLVSSYFYSADYSECLETQRELNFFYSKAEIDLNSFQILVAENSFFIPTISLPFSYFFESNLNSDEYDDKNLSEKVYLRGKDVILSLTRSYCYFNASEKSSVQMNTFNPYNYLYFNCSNITDIINNVQNNFINTDKKNNSTVNEKENNDDDDKKKIIGIVQLPEKNVFLSEVDDDKIVIFNKTVNDEIELKKFSRYYTVLPLSSQIVDLVLDDDTNTNFSDYLFVSPLCNDSQIIIQTDEELNTYSNKTIGFLLQNTSSEVTLNRTSPSISVKGIGNLSFTSLNSSNELTLNCITASPSTPLKLNFSEKFDSISVNRIDFFIRGSLQFESNNTLVSVKNVVVHQESVSKVNSLKLTENLTFKLNSKLEVTDEIKFGERSVIVFEFNESAKIGHFFRHKDDKDNLKNSLRPILTIPSFSIKTSGIPKQIVVKNSSVLTSFVLKPSTEYHPASTHFNQVTSPHLSKNNLKEVSDHHSLMISKLSSSYSSVLSANFFNESNNSDDDYDIEKFNEELDENLSSCSVLTLFCSDNFDLDLCYSLISSNLSGDYKLFESDFIVIENSFYECECYVNELNQTCIGLVDHSDKVSTIKFVHLSTSCLVGVIFGSIAAIAALIAVIFVGNGDYSLKHKGVRL